MTALPARAGRLDPDAARMNKTEAAYRDVLEVRKRVGDIAWYAFEAVTLRLGDDCRFTPDFMVMLADGVIELHEVKGFWRDDARVKIRVAASLYPFTFRAYRREKGAWSEETF